MCAQEILCNLVKSRQKGQFMEVSPVTSAKLDAITNVGHIYCVRVFVFCLRCFVHSNYDDDELCHFFVFPKL